MSKEIKNIHYWSEDNDIKEYYIYQMQAGTSSVCVFERRRAFTPRAAAIVYMLRCLLSRISVAVRVKKWTVA